MYEQKARNLRNVMNIYERVERSLASQNFLVFLSKTIFVREM